MLPITYKLILEQVEPSRSPRERLPTIYDLPSESPEEPSFYDEFHDFQHQLPSRTLRLTSYTHDNTLNVHSGVVNSVAFSDEQILASSRRIGDNTARIWWH